MSEKKSVIDQIIEQNAQNQQAANETAANANETQANETAVTSTTSQPQETSTEKPAETEKTVVKARTLDDFMAESTTAANEDKTDYKALLKETQEKYEKELQRFKNPVIERLAEVLQSPDLDVDTFFESHKPKDLKNLDLEELWVMHKKATSEVEYTPQELEEAFNDEMENIGDSSFKKKALKDSLIKELKPKVDLGKEPEYVTLLREQVKANREAVTQYQQAQAKQNQDIANTIKEMKDITIVGDLKITDAHVEAALKTLDAAYWANPDGSLNIKEIARMRVLTTVFNDVVAEYTKQAKFEAKTEVHRPNANSQTPIVNQADVVDPQLNMINSVIKDKSRLKDMPEFKGKL